MRTFVLRAWAKEDAEAPAAPLELVRIDEAGAQSIATHAEGVSTDPAFTLDGQPRTLAGLLAPNTLVQAQLLLDAGNELYARLAKGDVGTELAKIGKDRVRLDLRSAKLDELPWELIRRGEQRLFARPVQPWSLGTEVAPKLDPAAPGPTALEPPLRLLVVIGSPADDAVVKGDDELRKLEDRLHRCRTRILMQALVRPRSEEIRGALRDFAPHVFHFIGHGAVVNGTPIFRVYSDVEKKATSWTADDVRGALAQVPGVPRLVVLNACELGQPRSTWALTRAFLDEGALAVLAMQSDIPGDAALAFGDALYESLAAGNGIDAATASARLAITNLAGATGTSWPLPRLTVHGSIEEVLPLAAMEPPALVTGADDFVVRWDQRRDAWERLAHARLLPIEGPPRIGKSELLKVLAEMWSRVKRSAALYVHLGGSRTSDLACVAERIFEQAKRAPELDASALESVSAAAGDSAVGAALRKALELAARGQDFLVVLDGFETWESNIVTGPILRELCQPYATPGSSPTVRIAIGLPADRIGAARWQELGVEPLRLGNFGPGEWRQGAAQFIRLQRAKLEGMPVQLDRFLKRAWPNAGLKDPGEIDGDPLDEGYEPDMLRVIREVRELLARPR